MSVKERRLDLVDADELASRDPSPAPPAATRGWLGLYHSHVLQAEDGCDFDFLRDDQPHEPAP